MICNFCYFEDLKRFASETHRVIAVKSVLGEIQGLPDWEGERVVDVTIDGAWAARLMALPERCICTEGRSVYN